MDTSPFSNIENIERLAPPKPGLRKKIGMNIARLGLVGACILPTADLALSDAFGAKVLQWSQDGISMESETFERATELGVVGVEIMAESMLLGYAVSRPKRLRGIFGEFDDYQRKRQEEMRLPRRILSKTAHLPYKAIEKISLGFEWVGEKIATRKNKVARNVGKLIVDTARVNAMGTTNVILQETMAGREPTLRRNAELAGLITLTWIGFAEAIRAAYRNIDFLRPPLAAIGETFVELTSPDISNPLNTPTATAFLGSIAIGLGIAGWNMAKFHEQHQMPSVDSANQRA